MNYDIFICYSHLDKAFVLKLEKALKDYFPPFGMKVPKRKLNVFRDETEAAGTDLPSAIESALDRSRKLIVVCSTAAYQNSYWLNREIDYFAAVHEPGNIIPVLIDGRPNTEAERIKKIQESAFPSALVAQISEPWSVDFRKINNTSKKIQGEKNDWYHLLSCIYKVERSEIEQRERKRKIRRNIFISMLAVLILSSLWLFRQQYQEKQSLETAEKARRAFEKERSLNRGVLYLPESAKLAIEAVKLSPTPQSRDVLKLICNAYFDFVSEGRKYSQWQLQCMDAACEHIAVATDFGKGYIVDVKTEKTVSLCGNLFPHDLFEFSPDGKYILCYTYAGSAIQVWTSANGELLGNFENETTSMEGLAISFTPDGSGFVVSQSSEPLSVRKYQNLKQSKKIEGTYNFSFVFHPSGNYFVAFANNHVEDTSIRICNGLNGNKIWSYNVKNCYSDFSLLTNHGSRLISHISEEDSNYFTTGIFLTYYLVIDLDKNGMPLNIKRIIEKDFDYRLIFDGSNHFDETDTSDIYSSTGFLANLKGILDQSLAVKYPEIMGHIKHSEIMDQHGHSKIFISTDGLLAIKIAHDSIPYILDLPALEIKRRIDNWKFGRIEKIEIYKSKKSAVISGLNGIGVYSIDKSKMAWSKKRTGCDFYLSADESKLFVWNKDQGNINLSLYDANTGDWIKDLAAGARLVKFGVSGKCLLVGAAGKISLYDVDQDKIVLQRNFYASDSAQYFHDLKMISDSISPESLLEIAERRLINCSGYK